MTSSIRSGSCDPIASSAVCATPDVYPRLAYRDELAAVDYLTRVFQFTESREARQEHDGNHLCWMRVGTGVVMLGRANVDVHLIHSPLDAGLTTVAQGRGAQMNSWLFSARAQVGALQPERVTRVR